MVNDNSFDVESELRKLNVSYQDSGDEVKIRCISGLHEDRRPSLRVNLNTGMFHCFSCGYSGGWYKLYYQLTGKFFNEKSFNDITLDNIFFKPDNKNRTKEKKLPEIIHTEGELYDINNNIMGFLNSIGIYSEKFIQDYNISYTPFSRFIAKHLKDNVEKHTAFYKRILIPIYKNGKLVNIEGRAYEKDVKPKVIYVKGGLSDILFNIDKVNLDEPIIMVEGIKDFFKVWNIYPNVIACLGNGLGKKQAIELNEKVKDLIVFIDDDEAGIDLLEKLELQYNRDFKVIDPREGRDPNDLTFEEIKFKIDNEIESYGKFLHRKYIKEMDDREDISLLWKDMK